MENKVLRKVQRVSRDEYFRTHLQIVNSLLPVKLTTKEVEVLAAFMSLEGDIANDRFGTSARKFIKKKLNLSDGGLGNYLKTYRDKGFIIPSTDGTEQINPILNCQQGQQVYLLKLVNLEN